MDLTQAQKMSIARLYENESLTDNLTDDDAKALLEWAQQQIIADTDGELVKQAVSAGNQSGETDLKTLLAQANTFLAHELVARGKAATRAKDAPASMTMSADDAAAREAMRERKAEEIGAMPMTAPNAPRFQASGAASEQRLLTAHAGATMESTAQSAPASPKKSRKQSRKKKTTRKKSNLP